MDLSGTSRMASFTDLQLPDAPASTQAVEDHHVSLEVPSRRFSIKSKFGKIGRKSLEIGKALVGNSSGGSSSRWSGGKQQKDGGVDDGETSSVRQRLLSIARSKSVRQQADSHSHADVTVARVPSCVSEDRPLPETAAVTPLRPLSLHFDSPRLTQTPMPRRSIDSWVWSLEQGSREDENSISFSSIGSAALLEDDSSVYTAIAMPMRSVGAVEVTIPQPPGYSIVIEGGAPGTCYKVQLDCERQVGEVGGKIPNVLIPGFSCGFYCDMRGATQPLPFANGDKAAGDTTIVVRPWMPEGNHVVAQYPPLAQHPFIGMERAPGPLWNLFREEDEVMPRRRFSAARPLSDITEEISMLAPSPPLVAHQAVDETTHEEHIMEQELPNQEVLSLSSEPSSGLDRLAELLDTFRTDVQPEEDRFPTKVDAQTKRRGSLYIESQKRKLPTRIGSLKRPLSDSTPLSGMWTSNPVAGSALREGIAAPPMTRTESPHSNMSFGPDEQLILLEGEEALRRFEAASGSYMDLTQFTGIRSSSPPDPYPENLPTREAITSNEKALRVLGANTSSPVTTPRRTPFSLDVGSLETSAPTFRSEILAEPNMPSPPGSGAVTRTIQRLRKVKERGKSISFKRGRFGPES